MHYILIITIYGSYGLPQAITSIEFNDQGSCIAAMGEYNRIIDGKAISLCVQKGK